MGILSGGMILVTSKTEFLVVGVEYELLVRVRQPRLGFARIPPILIDGRVDLEDVSSDRLDKEATIT
jgi:hypothetical protein